MRSWLVILMLFLSGCSRFKTEKDSEKNRAPSIPANQSLQQARSGFKTEIVTQEGYKSDGPAPRPPAGVLNRITYRSPAGELVAYITPQPSDSRRRPAVIWAHGGFGGIGDWLYSPAKPRDDQTAAAFRDAGLVVMYPSWRGENENPGQFELFYGEVDDLLAARDHVASLPWVDPERIYLAGHSSGATLVLLAATASDRFRAAFAFGAWLGLDSDPDQLAQLRIMNSIRVPFNVNRPEESTLRSAIYFAGAIRRPTFYFEGESFFPPAMSQFVQSSQQRSAPFTAFSIPKENHWSILYPLTRLVADRINRDTGSECNIAISSTDIADAFARYPRTTPGGATGLTK